MPRILKYDSQEYEAAFLFKHFISSCREQEECNALFESEDIKPYFSATNKETDSCHMMPFRKSNSAPPIEMNFSSTYNMLDDEIKKFKAMNLQTPNNNEESDHKKDKEKIERVNKKCRRSSRRENNCLPTDKCSACYKSIKKSRPNKIYKKNFGRLKISNKENVLVQKDRAYNNREHHYQGIDCNHIRDIIPVKHESMRKNEMDYKDILSPNIEYQAYIIDDDTRLPYELPNNNTYSTHRSAKEMRGNDYTLDHNNRQEKHNDRHDELYDRQERTEVYNTRHKIPTLRYKDHRTRAFAEVCIKDIEMIKSTLDHSCDDFTATKDAPINIHNLDYSCEDFRDTEEVLAKKYKAKNAVIKCSANFPKAKNHKSNHTSLRISENKILQNDKKLHLRKNSIGQNIGNSSIRHIEHYSNFRDNYIVTKSNLNIRQSTIYREVDNTDSVDSLVYSVNEKEYESDEGSFYVDFNENTLNELPLVLKNGKYRALDNSKDLELRNNVKPINTSLEIDALSRYPKSRFLKKNDPIMAYRKVSSDEFSLETTEFEKERKEEQSQKRKGYICAYCDDKFEERIELADHLLQYHSTRT